jgi:NAD(P)-dependent dehydrogenase (short-subunit alcohol dehydrogenase family)
MRQRGRGRIVNVSSIMDRFALPGSGIYAASKFALEAASDALRIELAPFGVRVVLVEPGVIDTPLYQRAAAAVDGIAATRPKRRWHPAFASGTGLATSPAPALPSPDGATPTQPRRSTNQESADAKGHISEPLQ